MSLIEPGTKAPAFALKALLGGEKAQARPARHQERLSEQFDNLRPFDAVKGEARGCGPVLGVLAPGVAVASKRTEPAPETEAWTR